MDQALERVTPLNFCERAYLAANPDIAEAVRLGALRSGRSHFEVFGKSETHAGKTRTLPCDPGRNEEKE